jgi:ubiquinone/menaquinone biosynthesis C-methylase UbiE
MLERQLEPEVMDTAAEAADYDAMDHREVNERFVADLLAFARPIGEMLDMGTGTALIPIELVRQCPSAKVLGIDLSEPMLALARENIAAAGLEYSIRVEAADAKHLPYKDGQFAAILSNSIVHHIPEPAEALAEAVRVLAPGGIVFVRDLMRPRDETELARLAEMYSGGPKPEQRKMFVESLHAALTLAEIRGLVEALGFPASRVQATSDRHWTWSGHRL